VKFFILKIILGTTAYAQEISEIYVQSSSNPVVKLATEPCQGKPEKAWNVTCSPRYRFTHK